MKAARAWLWIAGLLFLAFGVAFTLWPLPSGRIVEIPLPTPTARIDFAAVYGGFTLGVGVFVLACARRDDWLEPGLWLTASSSAGFALVRVMGILAAAGRPLPVIYFGLASEVAGVVISVLLLRRLRREG